MIALPTEGLLGSFGFGVAGNFAGHLEQAGEAADFATVEAVDDAPKGIFPWYVPGAGSTDDASVPAFLGAFPLSADTISFPVGYDNLQIEPEVGLVAEPTYAADGTVIALHPVAVAAFNDCSIRRAGGDVVVKISEKKNWGPASKGVATRGFAITDLSATGPTASFRLASFLVRDEDTIAYGQDSAVPDYSYYGAQLIDWIVERLAHQPGSDATPLEPVGRYLRSCGNPQRVLIGIGATRYTAFGESTYLQPDDDSVVVVYDSGVHTPEDIATAVSQQRDGQLEAASVLRQTVTATA